MHPSRNGEALHRSLLHQGFFLPLQPIELAGEPG